MIRKLLGNTALVVGSIVLSLVLAEVVLRFTPYAAIPSGYSYPPGYFVADEELGYDIGKSVRPIMHQFDEHPYPVFSNSLGCFDYERVVPEGYTLVVGDSFAWGYTPIEQKWTTLLEQKSGHFILKCGVTGFGTRQELLKAKRVVSQVGINPRLIILLYSYNDINDDLMFPHRTVYGDGHLVSTKTGSNLVTGEVESMTTEQIKKRYAKYVAGSWSEQFNTLLSKSVLYRLWLMPRPGFRAWKAEIKKALGIAKPGASPPAQESTMPTVMKGVYGVALDEYLDTTDRLWFNQLLERHSETIRSFADYAHSIGARLVVVDVKGTLTHPRFRSLMQYLDAGGDAYYFDLYSEYPKQSTWRYDAHWNIEGNRDVAQKIYQFLSRQRLIEARQ